MPSEYRSRLINSARENRQFTYDLWPYILGIVEQMEAGLTLYEIITKVESRQIMPENELLFIDTASAWVRANAVVLELQLG